MVGWFLLQGNGNEEEEIAEGDELSNCVCVCWIAPNWRCGQKCFFEFKNYYTILSHVFFQ